MWTHLSAGDPDCTTNSVSLLLPSINFSWSYIGCAIPFLLTFFSIGAVLLHGTCCSLQNDVLVVVSILKNIFISRGARFRPILLPARIGIRAADLEFELLLPLHSKISDEAGSDGVRRQPDFVDEKPEDLPCIENGDFVKRRATIGYNDVGRTSNLHDADRNQHPKVNVDKGQGFFPREPQLRIRLFGYSDVIRILEGNQEDSGLETEESKGVPSDRFVGDVYEYLAKLHAQETIQRG
eukprot:CAMPEP_0201117682 /NCGR_PEP_ID=MMETSP0850-20130426/1687_1 /ASSEMBLY_ACC=CAM_ASM_000622 /TAXON_ID=183588 /ORGANISM="Pseudo-nitzschia fraudulenta, Strain WWA7" /LENGTH=237 /DNA_ID=CAMNT_0047382199 /DNA_START=61 /DNA_END=775 /DNA_ORIENTATION=+